MKKNKLLICALFMSMVLTVLPGMESYAAGETGEDAAATELQDENSQRLETVTAMDEEGDIYEVGETDGTVDESSDQSVEDESEDTEPAPKNGIAMFSMRSADIVSMKVVNFNTKGNDTTDFSYSGGSGYTNGAYGADAAYLGTDKSGNIRFMLGGVTGTVKKSEVQVLDYSSVGNNVSYYQVSGGKLIHYISYNLNQKPKSSINNGPAPAYLSEGVKYYSYDGHYFYDDYKTMLGDYQNSANGASAVNSGNPFYNYFQFLDMNSSTSYSGDELNNILSSKITSSSSKLRGTGTLFVKYQNQYSVNALLSLGIAVNESAWGTSNICMTKNNLFGLSAFDKTPGESSNYFSSVEDCIREFMSDWMADGYLSSSDWRNHGELLGNKGEGINVSYASDPYWGEKAAAIAWELDSAGGSHDYLGVSSDDSSDSSDVSDIPDSDNTPPADTEQPSDTDTSTGTEQPAEPETPSDDETVTDTDTSTEEEQPAEPETPSDDEIVTDTDTSAEEEQPAEPETPSDDEIVTDTDASTEVEQPAVSEKPADNEIVLDTDTNGASVKDENPSDDAETSQPVNDPTSNVGEAPSAAASEKQPSASVSDRTLVNTDQKIKVSGKLSSDAALDIRQIEPNTEQYNSYVSADPVKGKKILGVYDIKLAGTLDGNAQLTFQTGTEYNGRNVIILHYADDGSYETYRAVVENGQVSISVKGFSPYVIALDDAAPGTDTGSRAPQTGDTGNPGLWIALMALSASIGASALLRRKMSR